MGEGGTANSYGISCGDNENILKLIAMVANSNILKTLELGELYDVNSISIKLLY